ncbi:hypothetical protein N748_04405 [Legionella pneumophila str. 121004]|nr:hypothetical protein N748_04405 [Legionella pneumophila str. 121004]ERH42105.1 hypothetical protein N750_14840 [Legionella pneumophila str. Leg01/53]ERH45163.1 hypothetical protein N751_00480 [Legionella pneumophila str. Leg01/11]ERI46772.1 hypothetical protein N749_16700 [Legionella pneumophila str. Leg01/20]
MAALGATCQHNLDVGTQSIKNLIDGHQKVN